MEEVPGSIPGQAQRIFSLFTGASLKEGRADSKTRSHGIDKL